MNIKIFMLLISITFFYNCSTKEISTTNVSLLNDIWALETIEAEKIVLNENLKSLPMIEIYVGEERVYGNTSCNTINGSVKIDENQINFSNIITTEMACPGGLEQKFLSALNKTNNYKIEKMKLYLYQDDLELMIFQKID